MEDNNQVLEDFLLDNPTNSPAKIKKSTEHLQT